MALSDEGQLYIWGRGNYGVLGNGSNAYSLKPEANDEFTAMQEEDKEGFKIIKIDAADEYSGALTCKLLRDHYLQRTVCSSRGERTIEDRWVWALALESTWSSPRASLPRLKSRMPKRPPSE
jgi:hypothetical protein